MKTFKTSTLGCKVNQADTAEIVERLSGVGMEQVPDDGAADVVVVNGCAVTAEAESKSGKRVRQALREEAGLVIETGCSVRAREGKAGRHRGVREARSPAEVAFLVGGRAGKRRPAASAPESRTRALLKVQDGCDRDCAYCLVPRLRGRPRSRVPEDVVREARRLGREGAREVVLTGVNLGRYGRGAKEESSLLDLLDRLAGVSEVDRFRLSSVNVDDLTPDLLDFIGDERKFVGHLHIPLQSGSDRVLEAMNRGYRRLDFFRTVAALRARRSFAITTDVIIGFPGETEADFKQTLAAIEEAQCHKTHVFRFSARPGTRAALMAGRIPPDEARRRALETRELSNRLQSKRLKSLKGAVISVVVEEEAGEGNLTGTSEQYVKAVFPGPADLIGRIVRVRVLGAKLDRVEAAIDDDQVNWEPEAGAFG